MRILIPVLGFGRHGGYRVLSELSSAWISAGHHCDFLVPDTSQDPYFPTKGSILRYDRRGRRAITRSERKSTGLGNLLSLYSGLNEVGKDYDVILANHSLTAWPVRWSRTGRARKFYYVQAYEPHYYSVLRDPTKWLMSRLSYYLELRQISNSDAYGGSVRAIDTIPPGIDLSNFELKPEPGKFQNSELVVLGTVGRAEKHKGTSVALSAYRLLRKQNPGVFMRVALGNVQHSDDIAIIPIGNDGELSAFYRSVDILVVSCIGQRGAPHYPLIEAMASGTLVVHTGYSPGNSQNSWEVIGNSELEILQMLRVVISAPESERVTRALHARRDIEEGYSWAKVASRFIKHFHAP